MKDDFSKTIEDLANGDADFKKEWNILGEVEAIVDQLVAERKRQNLSQRDFAKLSGLKQEAIARIETMRAIPRLDTLLKIAMALSYEIVLSKRSNS